MCPYCAVRGRQARDGRPRDFTSAAAKVPEPKRMRESLVLHTDVRLQQADGKVTFGELNRRRSLRTSVMHGVRRSWRGPGGPSDGLGLRGPTKRAAAIAANHWRVRTWRTTSRVYSGSL